MEGRINLIGASPEDWISELKEWEDIGATHVAGMTSRGGLTSPNEHIDAIRRFKEAIG